MCPNNLLGKADLWVVSHHAQPMSNSPQLVCGLHPPVAILNNGTRKDLQPSAMKIILSLPRLEGLWQLHFSLISGQEYTEPRMFIANTTIDDQPTSMPLEPDDRPAAGARHASGTGSQSLVKAAEICLRENQI
jgi:hypothetical protein